MYKFQHDYMRFNKGGLDEKLVYDRYSTPEHDINKINVGDSVICKVEKSSDKRVVGELINKDDIENVVVEVRELDDKGVNKETKTFHHELVSKVLDTTPSDLWERWAYAGASVEINERKEDIENELRWLFDGYKFSPGGRIQLMAGQELRNGNKAQLTVFNCFVIPSPKISEDDYENAQTDSLSASNVIQAVIDNAINEAQIMSRGGGVGYNASTIPSNIMGAGTKKSDIVLHLPHDHQDSEILQDMISLDKFTNVTIETDPTAKYDNYRYIRAVDSREGLLNGVKEMAHHLYNGQKVFIDFSDIRHRGALVKGVNGRSSGAPSWMRLYQIVAWLLEMDEYGTVDTMEIQSYIVKLIEQGGSRRGALMIVLNCDHPSIRKFITRKQEFGYIEGANISVGFNDKFMKAKEVRGSDEADIWDLVVNSAWGSAEPGILFIERAKKESNSFYFKDEIKDRGYTEDNELFNVEGEVVATNPCGEQYLPPWAVCNLGHLVLSRFYDEENNDVDWDDLARACQVGVRFQDNMIDYTDYFMEENRIQQQAERRVGMGTMGLATLLVKLGIRYGSDEAMQFSDKLYKFIAVEAYKASIDLAEEKGAFPMCNPSKMQYSGFMQRLLHHLPEDYLVKFFEHGIRNVTLLTQAP